MVVTVYSSNQSVLISLGEVYTRKFAENSNYNLNFRGTQKIFPASYSSPHNVLQEPNNKSLDQLENDVYIKIDRFCYSSCSKHRKTLIFVFKSHFDDETVTPGNNVVISCILDAMVLRIWGAQDWFLLPTPWYISVQQNVVIFIMKGPLCCSLTSMQ